MSNHKREVAITRPAGLLFDQGGRKINALKFIRDYGIGKEIDGIGGKGTPTTDATIDGIFNGVLLGVGVAEGGGDP